MKNLKQISVKIDPETLEKLDDVVVTAKYWKRNAIINGILTALVDCCSDNDIIHLVRYNRHNPYSKPNVQIWKSQVNLKK